MIVDVVAAVISHQNQLFIAKRHPDSYLGGFWEFPGGKIEAGESPQQALKREIEEELSITVTVGHYLASSEHDYGDKIVRLHGYLCHWHGDRIALTGSHSEFAWIDANHIDRRTLAPADLPLLDALLVKMAN
ncbi:(deoxy)nucleoside triphosphate pyrophosphohydrolase [Ferrimonas senticii]|uniref:(deoxy)nucleoside triphosphate pyrophosphohydrolase n=1 Tax=Ferrimonas senticii TaxID=394566 RepID=UPI0004126FAB|nr:(deoxy)nucleoside triphosphate pyrophosphohydrolase [Ferrimonas senticii]